MEAIKKEKLKIAIDGHVLLQGNKTGVGRTAQFIIDELVNDTDVDVQLNFVDFLGYRCNKLIKKYRQKGCRIKFCWWLPYSVYRKQFEKLKIPYYLLFGKKNDVSLFFEYFVPYKVGTKVANYIYDVNYKVYPETVEKTNLKWLNENLQKYCDRSETIITISEFSRKEILKYLNIDKQNICVVPCGVDNDRYSEHLCSSQKERDKKIETVKNKYGISGNYILYLGTLEPRKNIGILIKAYNKLKQTENYLPKLVIAGKKGWMYDELFALVSSYDLKNDVIFTGYIDEEDNPVLMSGAEVFVFPSLYEGFGMPPLEAMACNTPVITSDAASLPEVVGDAAMQFRTDDYIDLSKKLGKMLSSNEEKKHFSMLGKERVRQYTWKNAEIKLVKVLQNTKASSDIFERI